MTTNLMDAPKIEMALKKVPFENGVGQALEICQLCGGAGSTSVATKTTTNTAGVESQTTHTFPTAQTKVNSYRRKGFTVSSKTCEHCKGAGTVIKESK